MACKFLIRSVVVDLASGGRDMVIRSKWQRCVTSFVFLIVSIGFALLVGEFILRVTLGAGNFLRPALIQDAILGQKIQAHSAGHDAWGYRNPSVPTSVDVVAIGDSQTYGFSASAKDSWPAQLQKLLHKDVYNLASGEFNPVQYYYLLKEKAIQLNPSLIIVGFYLGNDILGSYRTVYTNEYWKYLRKPNFSASHDTNLNHDDFLPKKHKIMRQLRSWLSHHSVLYRASVFAVGNTFRFIEMKYVYLDDNVTIFEDKTLNIRTGFTPERRLVALDLRDARIREGLRLNLHLIGNMHDLCRNHNINFMVVLIPTKERVFSKYIENNIQLDKSNVINELLKNEKNANTLVKDYLQEHKISYYDVLESFQKYIDKKIIYPQNEDGHPNRLGYAIIADSVKEFIHEKKLLDK